MGRIRYKIYEPTHFGNFNLCMHSSLGKVERATCLTLRDAVTFCHGRAKDPNPAGHNRQKEHTRRRIEDCKKKLNKCDTWF